MTSVFAYLSNTDSWAGSLEKMYFPGGGGGSGVLAELVKGTYATDVVAYVSNIPDNRSAMGGAANTTFGYSFGGYKSGLAGGNNRYKTTFATDTAAALSTLTVGVERSGGGANASVALHGGGSSNYNNTPRTRIYKTVIATDTTADSIGALSVARELVSAGFINGNVYFGPGLQNKNIVEKQFVATETVSLSTATNQNAYGATALVSSTDLHFAGCEGSRNVIKMSLATETWGTLANAVSEVVGSMAGARTPSVGFLSGGYTSNYTNKGRKVAFASGTVTDTTALNLPSARSFGAGDGL